MKHLSQIYQFAILSFLITLQFTAAWLSRNHLTRNSLSWLVNYATLIQTVYWLIFTPLHYKTHLRWTCQSSVSNMILFFLRFWINMLLYVKESSLLGLVPLGTVRKSRSRNWWRRSRLTSDYQSYTEQRTVVKNTTEEIILKIVNLSLESGHFPSSLKTAVLSPLLKKANLDHDWSSCKLQTYFKP